MNNPAKYLKFLYMKSWKRKKKKYRQENRLLARLTSKAARRLDKQEISSQNE